MKRYEIISGDSPKWWAKEVPTGLWCNAVSAAARISDLEAQLDMTVKRAEQLEHGSLQAQVNIRKLKAQLADREKRLAVAREAWKIVAYFARLGPGTGADRAITELDAALSDTPDKEDG